MAGFNPATQRGERACLPERIVRASCV